MSRGPADRTGSLFHDAPGIDEAEAVFAVPLLDSGDEATLAARDEAAPVVAREGAHQLRPDLEDLARVAPQRPAEELFAGDELLDVVGASVLEFAEGEDPRQTGVVQLEEPRQLAPNAQAFLLAHDPEDDDGVLLQILDPKRALAQIFEELESAREWRVGDGHGEGRS